MGESNSHTKRVAQIDAITESPEARALRVHSLLHGQVSEWDIVCYAISALGFLSVNHGWLRDRAISLNKDMYAAHYYAGDKLCIYAENLAPGITGSVPSNSSVAEPVSTDYPPTEEG